MASYDAIVVGTGTVGAFVAYHLAAIGLRLLVVDRAGLAAGTSRASDGNLLVSDKRASGPLFALAREGLALWAATIRELGNDCEYDAKGSVVATLDPAQAGALRDHVAAHAAAGVAAEFHGDGAERFEPHLAPEVCAIGWWADDVQVNPMLACYQLAQHLQGRGASYRLYDGVVGVTTGPSGAEVLLESGETASAGLVVLCTGVWTAALVAPLGVTLPVLPRKGQICVLERGPLTVRSKVADFAYNQTVDDADPSSTDTQTAAIVEQTRSGTILCGSSRIFAGFDTSLERDTLARILGDCLRLMPGLGALRVIRAYAGLRPYSPDGLPLIGSVDEHGRILVATGHEGSGHGLAPATGALVARLVAGESPACAAALDPKRFLG